MDINKSTYLKYLRQANSGLLGPLSSHGGSERRAVQELINEGLIADSKERFASSSPEHKCVITPKGAITLSDWERDIRMNSIGHKIGAAVVRVLWVFVGVLSTIITKYMLG